MSYRFGDCRAVITLYLFKGSNRFFNKLNKMSRNINASGLLKTNPARSRVSFTYFKGLFVKQQINTTNLQSKTTHCVKCNFFNLWCHLIGITDTSTSNVSSEVSISR